MEINISTKGKIMKAMSGLLKVAGCEGSTVKTWLVESFGRVVSESRGDASQDIALRIQEFCTVVQGLRQDFTRDVHKLMGEGCAKVVPLCHSIIKDTLPGIFQELTSQFYNACLDKQAWFQNASSGLMPQEESEDFWMRASLFEVPTDRLGCLTNMNCALKAVAASNPAQEASLQECNVAWQKGILMQKLSLFNFVVLRDQLGGEASIDTISESLKGLQAPVQQMMASYGRLQAQHADKAVVEGFQSYIVRAVVTPLGDKILPRVGSLVQKARPAIVVMFCLTSFFCLKGF